MTESIRAADDFGAIRQRRDEIGRPTSEAASRAPAIEPASGWSTIAVEDLPLGWTVHQGPYEFWRDAIHCRIFLPDGRAARVIVTGLEMIQDGQKLGALLKKKFDEIE